MGASDERPDEFHHRVLDRLPTAVVVVDGDGLITYGNQALDRLSGWTGEEVAGRSIFDFIHPDDLEMLVGAFEQLAQADDSASDSSDRPWAPINFRFVSRHGDIVPVEVTGNGSLDVAEIDGIIYEVRPAYERNILQRVLTGVASGGGLVGQLDLVIQVISSSSLDIDSGILVVDRHDDYQVARASSAELFEALNRAATSATLDGFDEHSSVPLFCDVASIEAPFGDDLRALGYRDAWHIDVAAELDERTYRIVAFTTVRHVPSMGVRDRLMRAAELASIVVLRVKSESLLERAAHHDPLTDLPNRLGLRRGVDDYQMQGVRLVALYVDLDGFKEVNDLYGHDIGDVALATVARRLVASTGADDLVARLGGDEFLVVLTATGSAAVGIDDIAQRLIDAIESPIVIGEHRMEVSASIGIVEFDAETNLDEAITAADRAMYVAKRAGGRRSQSGPLRPSS